MLKYLQSTPFDDAATEPQSKKYEPIKDGEYQFQIIETEQDETSGGYSVIKIKAEILGPQHIGRTVYHRIIVGHDDPSKQTAVSIGQSQLKTLCVANNQSGWPANVDQMVSWRFNAKLDYREYNGKYYEDLKSVKAYGPTSGSYGTSANYKAKLGAESLPASTSFNDDDIPF
jgi:hypothetical protein